MAFFKLIKTNKISHSYLLRCMFVSLFLYGLQYHWENRKSKSFYLFIDGSIFIMHYWTTQQIAKYLHPISYNIASKNLFQRNALVYQIDTGAKCEIYFVDCFRLNNHLNARIRLLPDNDICVCVCIKFFISFFSSLTIYSEYHFNGVFTFNAIYRRHIL